MQLRIVRALGIAVAAMVVLAACGSAASGGGAGQGSKRLSGTLKIATLSGFQQYTEPQAAFMKLHPGVKFESTQIPSNTYQPVTLAQLNSGTAPDIFDIFGGSGNAVSVGQLAPKGYLTDLSNQPWANKMPSVVKDDLSLHGKLYGGASYVEATGVVYNLALAQKLHITPPTTFSQMLSFCRAVSKDGIIPITLDNQVGSENELIPGDLANDIIYSKDPSWPKQIASGQQKFSGNSIWNSALLKGIEDYKQMNDDGCFEKNSTGVSNTEAYSQMATGQAFGTAAFANAIPMILADNPNIKLGTFGFPADNNPNHTWVTGDLGFVGAINAHTKNMAAAKAYLDYLSSPAEAEKAANANYGFPANPGKAKAAPTLNGLLSTYNAGRFALFPSAYYPNFNVKLTMEAQMQGVITGAATPQQALHQVEASYSGQ